MTPPPRLSNALVSRNSYNKTTCSMRGQSLFDLVATRDRLLWYRYNRYNSAVYTRAGFGLTRDEHLEFFGGLIIVLSLRSNDNALIDMIYDHVRPRRKEKI